MHTMKIGEQSQTQQSIFLSFEMPHKLNNTDQLATSTKARGKALAFILNVIIHSLHIQSPNPMLGAVCTYRSIQACSEEFLVLENKQQTKCEGHTGTDPSFILRPLYIPVVV